MQLNVLLIFRTYRERGYLGNNILVEHFPGGADGKESAYSMGDSGLIPGSWRCPGGGHSNPLQYSCLENSMDRGPGGLQSIRLQRVEHDWSYLACIHPYVCVIYCQSLQDFWTSPCEVCDVLVFSSCTLTRHKRFQIVIMQWFLHVPLTPSSTCLYLNNT